MINPAVCSLVPHFKDVHYNGIAGGLEKGIMGSIMHKMAFT